MLYFQSIFFVCKLQCWWSSVESIQKISHQLLLFVSPTLPLTFVNRISVNNFLHSLRPQQICYWYLPALSLVSFLISCPGPILLICIFSAKPGRKTESFRYLLCDLKSLSNPLQYNPKLCNFYICVLSVWISFLVCLCIRMSSRSRCSFRPASRSSLRFCSSYNLCEGRIDSYEYPSQQIAGSSIQSPFFTYRCSKLTHSSV